MKTLLQNMIRANSTETVGELACARVVQNYFQQAGIESEVDCWDGNRANVTARIRSTGERPALMFVCHLDVVPPGEVQWEHEPFSGLEKDGIIYGRGATDMKGGTAAAIVAMCQIVQEGIELKGDILLAATAGEETDSCGVERYVREATELPDLAGIVIPEPTDFTLIRAHRGLLWLRVTTYGKTAHGSAPHLGINAIGSMKTVLDALESFQLPNETHPLLGTGSISINTIEGGKALNVIPDVCTLGLDIRTLPGQQHADLLVQLVSLLDQLEDTIPNFKADIEMIRSVGALETDGQCDFVQSVCQATGIADTTAVGFTTDGPSLLPLGAPILIFGPGKGEVCHKPNESIAMSDVEKAVTHYRNIIENLLC